MVQEARLTVANKELASAQAQLDEKQKELDEVQAMYEFAMKEKQVSCFFTFCYQRRTIRTTLLFLGSLRRCRKLSSKNAGRLGSH